MRKGWNYLFRSSELETWELKDSFCCSCFGLWPTKPQWRKRKADLEVQTFLRKQRTGTKTLFSEIFLQIKRSKKLNISMIVFSLPIPPWTWKEMGPFIGEEMKIPVLISSNWWEIKDFEFWIWSRRYENRTLRECFFSGRQQKLINSCRDWIRKKKLKR